MRSMFQVLIFLNLKLSLGVIKFTKFDWISILQQQQKLEKIADTKFYSFPMNVFSKFPT